MALCQFFQRMKALNPKTLLVVSGPTASGKTALAIHLAQHFGTEIISADSRQFYKELPVGTAAPSNEEQSLIKHHFVGNLSVSDSLDVASYETEVLALLQQLFEIHDLVILCGGSGLFIDAVCEGLDAIPDTEDEIRKEVEKIYLEEGLSGLQKRIQEIDPEYLAIAHRSLLRARSHTQLTKLLLSADKAKLVASAPKISEWHLATWAKERTDIWMP